MLLDGVVAKAHSAPDPAEDLRLDSPFQEVVRAWRELASPSEAAVGDFLQQHEPPTIAQRQAQGRDRPRRLERRSRGSGEGDYAALPRLFVATP